MKKYLLFCTFLFVLFFLIFDLVLKEKNLKNERVVKIFNSIWEDTTEIGFNMIDNLPKMEIDEVDYIGVIKIDNYNLTLPIESNCKNASSTCRYSSKSFIILGSNLKSSFPNYKLYGIGDTIIFINTLGYEFKYKIKKIEKIKKLEEVTTYKDELIIIIRNYSNLKYLVFRCN